MSLEVDENRMTLGQKGNSMGMGEMMCHWR